MSQPLEIQNELCECCGQETTYVLAINDGYYKPEEYRCTVADFDAPGALWEGIGYEITEGSIIKVP